MVIMLKKWVFLEVTIISVLFISTITLYKISEASDNVPPITTLEFSGIHIQKNGIEWIGRSTYIWLNATDDTRIRYLHYEIWKDTNNDGIVDSLVESKNIYDNSFFYDKNPSYKVISFKLKISKECLYKIIYYSVDWANNVEYHGRNLEERWHYEFQPAVVHTADNIRFGSSPAISNLTGNRDLEIFTGSDELNNKYPELGNVTARGIWRCFDAYGNVLYAIDTKTDEARSSPAIDDIDGDGIKEIVAGTTSGWFLEVMKNGRLEWTFPAMTNGPVYGGPYVWHSSPAIADVNNSVNGKEIIIGNNPYHSVWCFCNRSDGKDDGITIDNSSSSPYFPWNRGRLGREGIDWDVLWVFNTSGSVIATPAIGDVNGDGWLDIVVGDLSGRLYVLNASNGKQEWNFTTSGAIYSSAALADIDGDGLKEILVGSNDGKLYCLEWDGSNGKQEWNFITAGAIYSSPAIGDVNGDGKYEIVFGSNDHYVYCLNRTGNLLWKFGTGGAVYSSPSLSAYKPGSYAIEWPIFRRDNYRDGFYNITGRNLSIFIGSDDGYLYEISQNGSLINKFLTNGKIHTSSSLADVDGNGYTNIVFYDWGAENHKRDTFWCLEDREKNIKFVKVDAIPPITLKDVVSNDTYNITATTDIWLNSTDGENCSSGVKFLHYEIWWDSDGNGVVDTLVKNETVYDNEIADHNSLEGEISALVHMENLGLNIIKWYAEDNLGNKEAIHTQEHRVIVYAPHLIIIKHDSKDPVHPGDYFNYTINVTNDGNENAYNVVIRERYDSNISFISSYPNPSYGNNEWNLGTIAPTQTKTIEIKVKVAKPLPNMLLHNYVNVTCSNGCYNETEETTQVISAPELEITKNAIDVNGLPLHPGDKIHYIINITNIGDMNQGNNYGNEFEDKIPLHTSYVPTSLTASSGTASYDSINNTIIWNGAINVGSLVTIEFDVETMLPLNNGTLIINNATLHWDNNGDGNNNAISHAYANLTVKSSPHLIIIKHAKPIVHPGDYFNYTINVTNDGNENAYNVVIRERYDSNISFISSYPNPSYGNNEWNLGTIAPTQTKTIEIKVKVAKPLPNMFLHNYVNVTCNQGCYNETEETTQVAVPVLRITKVGVPAVTEPGGMIKYVVVVRNDGIIEASNVVIRERYDSRVDFVSAIPVPSGGSDNEWHIGLLAAGSSFEIEVYVKVKLGVAEGSTLINFVNVTCDEGVSDEAWAYTSIKSYPPSTHKEFDGAVINITFFDEYVVHYILNTTTIQLVAIDNGSGVNVTYYRIFKLVDGKWQLLFDWHAYGIWNAYLPYYPINLAELALLYNYSACGKYEIEFYSIDKAGNVEAVKWNDVFVDCFAPSSYIKNLSVNGKKVSINAIANDVGVGIEKIALYYRYSNDNISWGNWTFYGYSYNHKWEIDFTKDGYYEFYTLAYDKLGNHEALPVGNAAKAYCRISYPWDINQDGRVNAGDIYIVIIHWMETPSSPNWYARADVNGDGIIDANDIIEITDHWTG